jgi:prepilin-type N-terminal cleavage/methylation domain-containing protein
MKYEELVVMNKKGFTLAEVFIALIIVGVMTVILFPIIKQSFPDQNKVMFRKTFNTLSQAVSNLGFDDVNYPESATGTITDTGQTVPQGFNNQLPTTTYASGTKFCTLLADQLNTIGPVVCGGSAGTGWGYFTTSDGGDWRTHEGLGTDYGYSCTDADCSKMFPMNMSTHAYQSKIFIDVNGPNKGPNCSTDSNAGAFPYGNGGAAITRCSWYNTCVAGSTNPAGTTPDRYIIGVRFDGNLHLGSSDSGAETDICGSNMLSEPTNNT